MQNGKRRAVRNTRSNVPRSGRFSSMSVANQHAESPAPRRGSHRPPHQASSASVQVASAPRQHPRSNGGSPKSAARGSGAKAENGTAKLAASLPFVPRGIVSGAVAKERDHGKRSSSGHKARMGRTQRLRMRGGASHPCPLCAQATRVLRTTKVATTVQRHRRCMNCHHEYLTTERRSK